MTIRQTASGKHATAAVEQAATATGAYVGSPPARPRLTSGRLAAIWRSEGAKGVWCRALARVGYRRWDRFVRPLDQPVTSRTPGVPIEIVTLAPADAAAYVALRPDATLAEYRQRVRGAQVCWAARHRDRLVAVKWVRCDAIEVPYLCRMFPLEPGEIYLYDMFTSPEMRGHHVQSALSAHIFAWYRAQGHHRSVGLVSPSNRASIASLARTGYRRSGWVSLVHLGPLRWERFRG